MIFAIALSVVGLFGADEFASPPQLGNSDLSQYLNEAAETHPSLKMRHAEWLAAVERIPQAKSLENPMFEFAQFINTDVQRARFEIKQSFPWFGTLQLRGDRAAAEADAALSRFFAERDAVYLKVKQSYYDYGFLAEEIRILEAQLEIYAFVEEVVAAKLSLALATDDELLRVGIARTEAEDRRNSMQQMRPALSAQLAVALGRSTGELLPFPEDRNAPELLPNFEETLAKIKAGNPLLDEFSHRMEALEKQEALAKKEGLPEMSLGFEWTIMKRMRVVQDIPQYGMPSETNAMKNGLGDFSTGGFDAKETKYVGGEDEFMVKLGVSVPLWRKKVKAGILEAQHMLDALAHEKYAEELGLENMARMTLYKIQDAERRNALLRDSLLPQAQQSYESLLEKYAGDTAGKSLIDILESVQTLLGFQLEQLRTLKDWKNAAAELEFLMGNPDKVSP